jgi:uncharacterized protein (TIGR03067 family)
MLAVEGSSSVEGSWRCESAIVNGKSLPQEVVQQLHLSLTKDRYKTEKGSQVLFDSSYAIDQSKSPAQINMIGTEGDLKGKQAEGIFSLKENTLTICYTMPGSPRPKSFESSPGSGAYLVVWTRHPARKP